MTEVKQDVYQAALAGLLHDIGKFAQRAGYKGNHAKIGAELLTKSQPLEHLIPESWRDDIEDAIVYHHGGDTHKLLTQVIRIGDWLASSERGKNAEQQKKQPAETPLIPITALAKLIEPGNTSDWGYPLYEVGNNKVLFPKQDIEKVSTDNYKQIWEEVFLPSVSNYPGPVDSAPRIMGLLDLLAQTTVYIPSATPWEDEPEERTLPDVPLYNHLHLTAAISVCLIQMPDDDVHNLHKAGQNRQFHNIKEPIARWFKIDFSGIQDFIYRITEPADERQFRNTAKRLRGRSLSLALLNQAIGEWLLQELELPPTNLLYAGGGVIELLLPINTNTDKRLTEAQNEIENGMWTTFKGALGIVSADVPMLPKDFENVQEKRQLLEEKIRAEKAHKWKQRVNSAELFQTQEIYHVCPVCGLTPVSNQGQICALCETHKHIGQELPKVKVLISGLTSSTSISASLKLPGHIKSTLVLANNTQAKDLLRQAEQENNQVLVRGINTFTKSEMWPNGSAPGYWSIANAAPVVNGEVYDFEEMAALSQGSKSLGILKADADRMGLLFSQGIHPPTFSRVATLSHTINRFFGEYLNQLTADLTTDWKKDFPEQAQKHAGLENIFYIMYAGGDDLFVIGPWDQTIKLAFSLRNRYKEYTCHNQHFTLSAGLIFVKPHFPVHQFARLADKAESEAKSNGRNRLSLFDQALPWEEMEELVNLGSCFSEYIQANKLPRSLIYDLGRLAEEQSSKPLLTPTLYYTLARRLNNMNKSEREEMTNRILKAMPHIKVPVSYASLITRKE